MYRLLIFLAFFVLFSCQKQTQNTNEEVETETVSIINEEKPPQENAVRLDFITISNEENFPLEKIIGAWRAGNPSSTIFIEFTNNGILYIHELYRYEDLLVEGFFPYKIEKNNIIIENINKSNNFDEKINNLLNLVFPPDIYIANLDDRSLKFESLVFRILDSNTSLEKYTRYPFNFYRGTMEEVLERSNIRINNENKLKEFIANELLNGVIYQGDINNGNGVINTYGVPTKDEITEYSDGKRYEGGGYLSGIREITYEDLKHRYYVFTNGDQCYVDVNVDKKLDRLTTINIGSASEEITAVFGSSYWRKEGEDIIYMLGGDGSPDPLRWVRFSIENNIVIKITYIITQWSS
jgi:hypothetical protein